MFTETETREEYRKKVLSRWGLTPDASVKIRRLTNQKAFWELYRQEKERMRKVGIYVYKDKDGDWVCDVKPLDATENREHEKLKSDLQRWSSRLVGCCVHFSQMSIEAYRMSNGVIQYSIFCPICQERKTSALPHNLVKHLRKVKGLEVRARAGQSGHTRRDLIINDIPQS